MATQPKPTNNLSIFLSMLLLLGASRGQAQDIPAPPPPPAISQGLTPGSGQAQDVVAPPPSHAIPEGLTPGNRDPFWPVGYAPKSAAAIERERALAEAARNKISGPKWAEAKATMHVGGYIKTSGGYSVLVNNSVVSPSDVISLIYDGKQYRWKVESVSANGISFTPLDWISVESKPKIPGKDRP